MIEPGYITRCPHCDTSFRVNDAQLAAAGGAVRCGACLLVFTATEHLVAGAGEDVEASEAEREPSAESTDDPLEHRPEIEAAQPFDWEIGPEITEDSPVVIGFGSLVRTSSSMMVVDASEDTEDVGAMDEAAGFDDEPESYLPPEEMPEDFEPPRDLAAVEEDGDIADDEDIHFVVDTDPDELIAERGEPSRPQFRWWFAAACLVLLAAFQFAWFERDRYALDPQYRDAYLVACRWLPCDLPEYSDPDALHISGLIIRSHPNRDNALKVDALLVNDAPWRQAFPALRLHFSDLDNEEVAARIFRPEEYLAGEMAGLRYIPGQTEVRVSLAIVDPGPRAMNYAMEIL